MKEAQTTRPLRVMQVCTCYDKYREAFYAERSHLFRDSYQNQIHAMVNDAYAAIHVVVPYLLGCSTMLVMANCLDMQRSWLRENGVPCFEGDDWQSETLRRQISRFCPDVLYLTATGQFSSEFIASLPQRPPLVLGWRASDVPFGTDWSGFDIMLTGLSRLAALAESLGAQKGLMFFPGMPAWIFREVENIPQDTDVVFVGSINPSQHVRRLALLEALADGATRYGFSLALHLNCNPALLSPALHPYLKPVVFGLEMHKALRRGRIVFDTQGTIGLCKPNGSYAIDLAAGETINMRLFEATGGGSLLLTEDIPGIVRYFEPGQEVITYTSPADVVEKINYYLAHDSERERIATAGKERCMREWNMQNCANRFLNIIQEHMPV